MIQTRHLALLSVLRFLEGKPNSIICYPACDLLVSLQLVTCLQFPGFHWLVTNHSIPWHVFLHENHVSWLVFHVDPRKLQYFCFLPSLKFIWFPYMIYELYCASQPMRKPRKNASCWWDPESSILRQRKTNMSPKKKGHFKKQGSLPTTIFSRTCKFSGEINFRFFCDCFCVVCVYQFILSFHQDPNPPSFVPIFWMDPNSRFLPGFLPVPFGSFRAGPSF